MTQSAQQKTALILLVDDKVAQVSQKTIEDMGHRCVVVQDQREAEELLSGQSIDLLLCKIRDKAEDFRLFDMTKKIRPNCRCIAIIDESLEEYFPELAIRAYPHNLIADNQPFDLQELTSTIQKLLSEDIFGIEKYSVPVHECLRVTRSDQKYTFIEKVRDFFLANGVQERIVRNVELILNELLMNAIFDAPTDDKGEQPYFHLDRAAAFDLKPREQPEMRYGLGEDHLAVSVSDPFGTFNEETFFSYVHRCFSEKSILEGTGKGAGMGLFLVFKSLNQLVINVSHQQRTEVIALIDHRASLRELKKRRHSFHYFHLGNDHKGSKVP